MCGPSRRQYPEPLESDDTLGEFFPNPKPPKGTVVTRSILHHALTPRIQKAKWMKKSPIYLFYEIVTNGPDGTPGDDGDVHYRCVHGSHKICTIKRSMKSNVNGESRLRLAACPSYYTD
jgi:hypothetical protein